MGAPDVTAAKSYLSGFCGYGNPPESHDRCPGAYENLPCRCDCHVDYNVVDATVLDTPAGVIVTNAEPTTPEWFAARRQGITGTDLPAILGMSKYGNALAVWLDKRDELDDDTDNEAARWGNVLEHPVAEEWAERNDALIEPIGVVARHDMPWVRASLDRRVLACPDGTGECGLEIKTRSAFKASEWRDGVPDDVLAQVAWGMAATGYTHMHVAALIGGQRLATFRVDHDPKLEEYLLDAARTVWDAVQIGTPPETHPDAEGVLLDLLDRLYTRRAGDRELDPTEAGKWLDQYDAGHDLETEGKRLKTQAKTALVQLIDDGEAGLIDDVPVFSYRAPDPTDSLTATALRGLRTDQPDLYAALKDEGYITRTNPRPRFNLTRKTKEKQT